MLTKARAARTIAAGAAALLLATVLACGGASEPEEVSIPPADEQKPATETPAATTVAPAIVTRAPALIAEPENQAPTGILTVGQKELGPFMGHPAVAGNPFHYSSPPATLTMALPKFSPRISRQNRPGAAARPSTQSSR